jgi:hypothetical protein
MISLLKLGSSITQRREKKKIVRSKRRRNRLRCLFTFHVCHKVPPYTEKYTGRLIRFLEFTGLVQGTIEERSKAFVDSARKNNKSALIVSYAFFRLKSNRWSKGKLVLLPFTIMLNPSNYSAKYQK